MIDRNRFPFRIQNTASKAWPMYAIALASFVCGSLITAHMTRLESVKAESNQVFELMVYHTVPGKVPELESIFQDVSRLQEQHNLHVLGYWVPTEDPAWKDTFVYVVVHPSLAEAQKNWDSLHADPTFLPFRKAAAPLIQVVNGKYNVDEVYMKPSDFSSVK